MRKELEAHLIERHPQLLSGTRVACPDGWHALLDILCAALQQETERNGAAQLLAVEIKFTELRFYVEGGASERQRAMIQLAAALSARTCETCGASGECWVTRDGLYFVACDRHKLGRGPAPRLARDARAEKGAL